MNSPTGLSKMKVQAHKVDVLVLSTDTFTSDIERFFSVQGVDITRNRFGELLFVEMNGVTYHAGKTYFKSPDGSIKEYTGYSYTDFSDTSSIFVVTDREEAIYRLKNIFEGWPGRRIDKLNALELLLAENKIQIGGLVEGRKSLIFKYINDPKGKWLTVNVDEICEPSKTKWQLAFDGRTIMVKHHPIFDHEIILKMVAPQTDKLYFGGTS